MISFFKVLLKNKTKKASLPATSPNIRKECRERLYEAVRKIMLGCGFLSASYTFKVLTMDEKGSQFIVMINLTDIQQSQKFFEIEKSICVYAKNYGLQVQSVYWRGQGLSSHKPKPSRGNFEEDLALVRSTLAAVNASMPSAKTIFSTTDQFKKTPDSSGFADTVILDFDESSLSGTQYASL